MGRLTITLEDNLHRALEETAEREGRSVASIIEESLQQSRIRDRLSAAVLVSQARQHAQLESGEAVAVAETHAVRSQGRRSREV